MRRIRIGFHGVPGAGKTVLQTMFYGFRDLGDGSIVFNDAATIGYLRPRWEQMSCQRTPPASAMGKPDRLLWKFKTQMGEWEIVALDFAGVLVEPIGNDVIATRLAEEVHSFLAGCDGLFLLVDASNPDQRQLDALAVLLSNLRTQSETANGGLTRPVGLLLTKFDSLGPIDPDPRTNQLRAIECLRGHQILKPIRDLLACEQNGVWWYRVFPVSAFGTSCKEGAVPPKELLKPYNLHEPLRWLVGQVDAELTQADERRRRRKRRKSVVAIASTIIVLFAGLLFVRWQLAADRLQYSRIYDTANGATSWDQFDAAITYAEEYHQAFRIKRKGRPVEHFLKWAQEIKDGKIGWHVLVSKADDPSDLTVWWFAWLRDPGLSFVLHLNGQTGNTRQNFVSDGASARNYDCGMFPIKWGQPLRVQMNLSVYNKGGESATGNLYFTPLIGTTERDVSVKLSGNGEPVVVLKLKCEGLAPPPLPPYDE